MVCSQEDRGASHHGEQKCRETHRHACPAQPQEQEPVPQALRLPGKEEIRNGLEVEVEVEVRRPSE